MFDKEIAERHLQKLLKEHKIKVIKWSVTSCGRAYWKKRKVKIPKPTNVDRFGVCMHEIKHIIDGKKGKRFEQEFACDMFAREQMILLGFNNGIQNWDKRTNWHCLSRIAMAVNRKMDVEKISINIKEWFNFVDFSKWKNKKVFIRHNDKEELGYTIEFYDKMSLMDVKVLLREKGLLIEKSESNDSNYGKWMVKSRHQDFGTAFSNLTEVAKYYSLTAN